MPHNAAADAALVNNVGAWLEQCEPDTVYLWISYTYSGTDSAFDMLDANGWLYRVFEPTSFPDGVLEVNRSNQVAEIGHASPLKITYYNWSDVSSLVGGDVKAASIHLINEARKECKNLRKAVDNTMRIDKKLDRIKAWKAVKTKKKTDKLKTINR